MYDKYYTLCNFYIYFCFQNVIQGTKKIAHSKLYEHAHPNHDKYLNKKKLDMYEAMTIIVGKDMTTGNYAKSYANVNLEENTEEQSISIENEVEYEETSKEKETSSSSV
jgi:hypothetical protein